MNLEAINKWLDEEYDCSYTRLEELHDFYFEKYCDLKKENKQLKDNWKKLKEWLVQLQKFKGINQQGFSWGLAQEVLNKMEEIEKSLYNEKSN